MPFRRLLRTPAFTLFAVLSLALGIGATTAVFSLIASLFWRPIGVPQPNRLVVLTHQQGANPARWRFVVSRRDYDALQSAIGRDGWLAAAAATSQSIATADTSAVALAEAVTGNYFSTLGVDLIAGRSIGRDDDRPGAASVVVLSERFWQATFGGDRTIVGRTVRLGGQPFTVLGIADRRFGGLTHQRPGDSDTDAWISWNAALRVSQYLRTDGQHLDFGPLSVFGRLAANTSAEQMAAMFATVGRQLDRALPIEEAGATDRPPVQVPRNWSARTLPAAQDEEMRDDGSTSASALAVALIAMVVVVACTNLANLVLGRGAAREHEIAVRRALGASTGRLVREQMAESGIVAFAGGFGAVLVARALLVDGTIDLPNGYYRVIHIEPHLDARALMFAAAALLASLVVFGLLPAVELTRAALRTRLSSEGGSVGSSRWRTRSRLIAAQVALCTALLLVAALCVKVVARQAVHDPGIDLAHLAIGSVTLGAQGPDDDRARRTTAAITLAAQAPEPFEVAALTSNVPFSGGVRNVLAIIGPPDRPLTDQRQGHVEVLISATPAIFRTLGIPLLSGRGFDERDDTSAESVVVLSEHAARDVFGTTEAAGRTIRYLGSMNAPDDGEPSRTLRVVGVSQDTDTQQLFSRQIGAIFLPLAQQHATRLFLIARTAGDPSAAIPALASIVRHADPDLALERATTGPKLLATAYFTAGIGAKLFGGLATVALVLAMSGLYGVLALVVARRRREIGLRMALGADAHRIRSLVLREGLWPVVQGLVVGYGLGVLGRAVLMSTVDAGSRLSPVDPVAFLLAAAPLGAAAIVACYVPARRASLVDPNTALREL